MTSLAEGNRDYTAGSNDFGNSGYGGPMPPNGHGEHRYYFWILALDIETDFAEGLTMKALLEAVEPHALGINRLVGTYHRD